MRRTEETEWTVLCLIHDGDRYLLQDRVKEDWKGLTLPGGHIEKGESIVDAVVREVREETGLLIHHPRLRGIKQFPDGEVRYLVFMFEAVDFEGELVSSKEGKMSWIKRADLKGRNTVNDLEQMIDVILSDELTEFQYVLQDEQWSVHIR